MISTTWRKSSYSQGGATNCVECRTDRDRVEVRDSQHPAHSHLAFPVAEWRAFLAEVQEGTL